MARSLTASVDAGTYDRVRAAAGRCGVSVSRWVAEAVEIALEVDERPAEPATVGHTPQAITNLLPRRLGLTRVDMPAGRRFLR